MDQYRPRPGGGVRGGAFRPVVAADIRERVIRLSIREWSRHRRLCPDAGRSAGLACRRLTCLRRLQLDDIELHIQHQGSDHDHIKGGKVRPAARCQSGGRFGRSRRPPRLGRDGLLDDGRPAGCNAVSTNLGHAIQWRSCKLTRFVIQFFQRRTVDSGQRLGYRRFRTHTGRRRRSLGRGPADWLRKLLHAQQRLRVKRPQRRVLADP